ncbi:MAG: hypothetical protein IKI24_02895 [Clostridia bacterium]|nr:hypothetical protein [Clostridia bacterium]MCR4577200.1 hypothetical protein [Clostridiales bacterium]
MANEGWSRRDEIARRVERFKQAAERAQAEYGETSAPERRRGGVIRKLKLAALFIARVFLNRD